MMHDDDCDENQFSNRIKHLSHWNQESSSTKLKVKVSPNPTSSILYITYNLNSDVVFEILNAEGLSCVKLNLEASKTTRVLNLEHLNSGYYIYKVILTNGFFEVGKFCIVR
ncbi:MAG: T9SS type A sorting domain-containing protein [Bacteroidetes bacterium]|nr:T9SS type A sorting domain-containing protein [Bacteroidota bacterium]